MPVCGEDVEVVERLTYLGSDIHVSACWKPEVDRHLGQACGVIDSLLVAMQEDDSPNL